MQCPACGHGPAKRGLSIGFCRRCGHRWLLTTPGRHAAVEKATYTDEYPGYIADQTFARFASTFLDQSIVPRCPPPARLLDVGCGAGDFLVIAKAAGYAVSGIDVSEAAVGICRSKGVEARAGDLLSEDMPKFDIITMWDVVEHLRDPAALFARAAEVLGDRGILFAKVPAFGSLSVGLSNVIPRLSGLLLGAPGHVQYFTGTSLDRLARRTGYSVECGRAGHLRSRRPPGSLRRRVGQAVQAAVKDLSGDHNLMLFATKSVSPRD